MDNEIQKLREELNKAIQEQPLDSQKILNLSVELDKLILEYYK